MSRTLRRFVGLAWIWCTCAAVVHTGMPLRGQETIEALERQSIYDDLRRAATAAAVREEVPSSQAGSHVAGFTGQGKLAASDGAANDEFGYAVALSGDTAVVGAYAYSTDTASQLGSAYVFVRSGGTWTQQQKLTASDGFAGDHLGWSVALSGDTALVGAPTADISTTLNQGSAYVFVRNGGTWTLQQRLTASDGAANDEFGHSVALSGDTALVGARSTDIDDKANQGSVYVFVRSGGTWALQQKLTASDGAASDEFGYSVASSNEAAVVGARLADVDSKANQGSAYVFQRTDGVWDQRQKLTASDGAANDEFGYSVALSEDTVLVGALWDVGAMANQGSAYAFVRREGAWIGQAKLTASDGGPADRFARSVALSGDRALVGAYMVDIGGNSDQGVAYLFVRNDGTWNQQQKLTSPEASASDWFGWSVALGGNTALVGAPRDNIGANADQGSVDTFFAPAPQVTTISTVSAASFLGDNPVASASIAAGFGQDLAADTQVAPSAMPLPASIAGVSVKVKDSAGAERQAPLWFVSPTQINYYIADDTALGPASVSVVYDSQIVADGTLSIERVAPGLFGMNANGQGVPAALAIFVKADGTQTWHYVFNSGCQVGSCQPVPLDLGAPADRVVLLLYGTGIRGRSSLGTVSATIGGVDAPVEYAGPVEGMVGLDQVNVQLPRSLAGRGEVDIMLTVDGKTANTMRINIQ